MRTNTKVNFFIKTKRGVKNKLKQLITVHSHNCNQRSGFESSQQNRMYLAKLLNIPYIHIVTNPQDENFEDKFKKMGFTDATLVSLGRSLFGTDAIMENPYLYYYERDNKIIAKAFYDVDCEYNVIPMWMYEYFGDNSSGHWLCSEEIALVKILSNTPLLDSVVIRDESRFPMPVLKRFLRNKNVPYFEYIHYPVITEEWRKCLSKKTQYLVANEDVARLLKGLGYHAQFFPPMCVEDELKPRIINNCKSYVWSGHFGPYKRFDKALTIMKQLQNTGITLDVYGGDKDSFKEACDMIGGCPSNVSYKGSVTKVPYEKYDGYLSTSFNEMFANSCVEAMSQGLLCMVSDYPYPYKTYSEATHNSVKTNPSISEYVENMLKFSVQRFDSKIQQDFLKKYSYSVWALKLKNLKSI